MLLSQVSYTVSMIVTYNNSELCMRSNSAVVNYHCGNMYVRICMYVC